MGVIAGEGHLGLEITTVVQGFRIEHYEGYAPFEHVVVHKLGSGQSLIDSFTGGRHFVVEIATVAMRTSILVHVSLLRALNSFMSTRCATSAMFAVSFGI